NLAASNEKAIGFVLTIMDSDLSYQTTLRYGQMDIKHFWVKKRDERDENLIDNFGELCARIESELQSGRKVLVHCAMGISRSATIVCAYIMQRYGLSRSEAKEMVKAKRSVVGPNSGFYTQLKAWERCKYDIHSAILIDGVRVFKAEYNEWLAKFEETNAKEKRKLEERETRRRERESGEERSSSS
ncbi:MAG: hypothetical protein Q9218_003961, partial [Villophora microphyllina]